MDDDLRFGVRAKVWTHALVIISHICMHSSSWLCYNFTPHQMTANGRHAEAEPVTQSSLADDQTEMEPNTTTDIALERDRRDML
jgi:hypothetical protein